jgi:hypothetical protein
MKPITNANPQKNYQNPLTPSIGQGSWLHKATFGAKRPIRPNFCVVAVGASAYQLDADFLGDKNKAGNLHRSDTVLPATTEAS